MGTGTDAALATLVLVAVGGAFALVDARVSLIAALAGGCGTVAFELAAARDPELVREYWDRASVQIAAVALTIAAIAVGARFAPSIVLSFALGSLATYLAFLVAVSVADRA